MQASDAEAIITRANYSPKQCEQTQHVPNHHNLKVYEATTIQVGIPNLECPNSQNSKIKFPAKILRTIYVLEI